MSEVNQAFLRAYLKNRAAESSSTSSAPVATESRPTQNPVAARPSATAPRQPSQPLMHPTQAMASGANLRFDPSHNEQAHLAPVQPLVKVPMAPTAQPQDTSQRAAPRPGVWSSLGAERGMKALERNSNPAIVRNGVNAIPTAATQYRRPSAPAENPSYDQVMFVDGLPAATEFRRPHGPTPTERTLAEIAEPIAFGTGVPNAPAIPTRPHPLPTDSPLSKTRELPSRTAAPLRESHGGPEEATRTRRFDPSHLRDAAQQKELQLERELTNQKQLAHLNDLALQREQANQRELAEKRERAHREQALREQSQREQAHREQALREQQQRNADTVPTVPSFPKTKTATSPNSLPLPLPVAFAPSWEVDQFFWPEVVKHIETSNKEAFQQIGKHLSLANRDGLKVMAITSGERGVGRSTVAMHMARCAASAGLRVALLDGDTFCPSLIDQLRLDMKQGWQDCLFENVPLQDIAIHSLADQITLFPLTSIISQQQAHANLHRMVKLVRRISNAFDMVFIDGSRLNLEQRDLVGVGVGQENVVDAAIVVTDTELSVKEKVDSAVSILQGMGISSIGLVENFQS